MLPAERRGTGAKTLTFAIVAVLALLIASPASAKTKRFTVGDFQYAKASSSIPSAGPMEATSGEVSPKCDKGWKLTGGGAFPKGLPGHTRLASTGIFGDRRWFAQAIHGDSDKSKLIGYSVCVRDRIVDSDTSVHPVGTAAGTSSHQVACPSGLAALGGGVEVTGAPNIWGINSTNPIDDGSDADDFPDDGWKDYMLFGGDTVNRSYLVEVICGEDLPAYETKGVTLAAGFNAKAATAKCQSGHITGGGVFITGAVDEATVVTSYPIDGKDKNKAPDDGWRALATNEHGASEKTLTAYAICL
jgi:hypothetical protein